MKEEIKLKVQNRLDDMVQTDSMIHNAYLLVHSEKNEIHWNMASGTTNQVKALADQRYHTASIGKMFTAVIIVKLAEQGKINYEDRIVDYLSEDICRGLHVCKGTDYSNRIQIKHLLSHTSGLPDYFEDQPIQGESFLEMTLKEPNVFWTPEETIKWSKRYLKPRFEPGKKCRYSDTGYNLLGLIIENITSKPYQDVLHEYIFNPLNMNNSFLSQYSEPNDQTNEPIANVYLGNQKIIVEDYRSFSSFYAGGQTVSTSEDLLKFMKALVNHELIQGKSLKEMQQWRRMWGLGISYGYGLMNIKLLPFMKKYAGWGHLGSISSFALYFPVLDVYVIGNFNQSKRVHKSMRFMLSVLRELSKK
ncbi:serine hydrolase domain-containing protein [Piscibacillus sp. B03]|uniref:serine hydrolase domain-containing protein n=1 Tax=Piscibacillus sp. B03 TaxID=3457430 RepID=UPI003FCD3D22